MICKLYNLDNYLPRQVTNYIIKQYKAGNREDFIDDRSRKIFKN